MTKRSKTLLISMITVMLAVILVIGGTYALFTDEVTLNTHLKAGNLDITLKRTNLTWTELATDGYLDEKTNTTVVDFSNPTSENVFGIASGDKIVPCMYYNATMQITNNSTVAFKYWVEVVVNGTVTSENQALADQLKVTVNTTEGTVTSGVTVGSETAPVGTVAVGGSATFTVKVEFTNVDDNNDAMDQEVSFDLIVHAVQQTTRP